METTLCATIFATLSEQCQILCDSTEEVQNPCFRMDNFNEHTKVFRDERKVALTLPAPIAGTLCACVSSRTLNPQAPTVIRVFSHGEPAVISTPNHANDDQEHSQEPSSPLETTESERSKAHKYVFS